MSYTSSQKKSNSTFGFSSGEFSMISFLLLILLTLSLLAVLFSLFCNPAFASRAQKLEQKIEERNKEITQLENEIRKYKSKLNEVADREQTLNNVIESLDISRNKIKADIELTQNKINAKAMEIEQLSGMISTKEHKMEENREVMSASLREMNELESRTLLEALFSFDNLGDFWSCLHDLERFQDTIVVHLEELKELKRDLEKNQVKERQKQKELLSLRRDLYERKHSLDIARQEKNKLLQQTKNKESNYQQILAQKHKRKEQFEKELRRFESQLEIIVDPDKIPSTGSGILAWPLEYVYITQYFGDTPFSTNNPQVYPGTGHNGVDFRASPGTPVKASLAGVVKNFSNTDNNCPGASYGRWILVEHENGLSTLYAHLSDIAVSRGQRVATEETIGYSGNSGYSTGPHLHFGVYATEGVKVSKMKSRACKGAIYTLPIADFDAYLNPMSYLPKN